MELIRLEQRQNNPFDMKTISYRFTFSRKERAQFVVENYKTLFKLVSKRDLI